jgi:hypothetical protein
MHGSMNIKDICYQVLDREALISGVDEGQINDDP